jgi:Transposase
VKRSKCAEEQIDFAVKQAEVGMSVEEVCRKMGISDATRPRAAATSLIRASSGRASGARDR